MRGEYEKIKEEKKSKLVFQLKGKRPKRMVNMRIGDVVNVKDLVSGGYWKGKITEIHNNREIVVQDKGINFAELNIDDLIFDRNEYWEK